MIKSSKDSLINLLDKSKRSKMNPLELLRSIFNLLLYNFLYLTDFHDIFGFLCTVKNIIKNLDKNYRG